MIEIVDVAVGPNACPLSSRICIDIKYVSKVELEGVTFVAKVRVVSLSLSLSFARVFKHLRFFAMHSIYRISLKRRIKVRSSNLFDSQKTLYIYIHAYSYNRNNVGGED